jgi:hypothetical protein
LSTDRSNEAPAHVGYLVAAALTARLAAWALFNLWFYDGGLEHPDSMLYHREATAYLIPWGERILHKGGYSFFLHVLYGFVGSSHLLGSLANVLMGSLIPLVGFRIADRFFGRRAAWGTGMLMALDPGLIYWSTQLLKDTLLFLLFLVIVDHLHTDGERSSARSLGIVGAAIVLLATLRPELAFLTVAVFMVFRQQERRGRILTAAMLAVFVYVGIDLAVRPWLEEHYPGNAFSINGVLALINSVRIATNVQGHVTFYDASLPKTTFLTMGALARFALLTPVLFCLVPFPWDAHNTFEILFLSYVAFWYATVFLGLIGIFSVRKRRAWFWSLLALLVVLALPLTLAITSTAPYVRWRVPAGLLLGLFSGQGLVVVSAWMRAQLVPPRGLLPSLSPIPHGKDLS